MINSEPTPIGFRSVSEQRAATAFLLKEGQWNGETQTFLTRETQLQEVSRHFMKQHQLLRVSPALLYNNEGRDLNAVYPQAPKELLKNYHVEASKLGEADPNPSHIKEIADVLSRRKTEGDHHNNKNSNNQNSSSRRKSLGDDNNNDLDDEEDDEDEDEFASSTPFGASAQDARSQLEGDFLNIARGFDSRGESGVASHILSPSKYSRPSPFISGSHARKPKKDKGFISGRASEVLTSARSGNHNANHLTGDDSNAGGGAFFMTDMSTVGSSARNYNDDDENDDEYNNNNDSDEEVTGHQLTLSQSKLNSSRNNERKSSTGRQSSTTSIPKLPTLGNNNSSRNNNNNNNMIGTPLVSGTPKSNSNNRRLSSANKYGKNISPIRARTLANATAFSNTLAGQQHSPVNPYEDANAMLNSTPVSIARYNQRANNNNNSNNTPSAQRQQNNTTQASHYLSRGQEPVYSSLLHELRCTRQEVEADAKRSSTLQAIANLGGTPEFRRTVTRIFANPDEADRISEEEMRRRQKLYEKLSMQQHKMDQEAEAAIGSSTLSMSRFGGNSQQKNEGSSGNVGQDAVAAFERDMAAVASKLSM